MKSTPSWRKGCYQLIVPNTALFLSMSAGLVLTLGTAKAQTFDVNNKDTNLTDSGAWTPSTSNGKTAPPDATGGAVWDQSQATNPSNLNANFTTAPSNTEWNSIEVTNWNDSAHTSDGSNTVLINTSATAPINSNTITLTGSSTAISTQNAGLDIGNLNIDPELVSGASSATFNLQKQLTITGALGTAVGNSTTVIVNNGGPLNLVGDSNSGSILNFPGQTSGNVNLAFQNNSAFTLGNNHTQTFGQLVINGNTSLNEDFNSNSTQAFNNKAFAITTKTQETFTGGLAFTSPNYTLTIYGWQGPQLGATSSAGQLLFNNDNNSLPLGTEVTNVIFDLAGNQAGPTTSNIISAGSVYDYGEWIADPNNSGLDELVPYAVVPEPSTILAGMILVGALVWRERRRLAPLFALPARVS
jgi:hypothetical protein